MKSSNHTNDRDKIRLTGLWKHNATSGGAYLSGKFGGGQLLVLPNTYKANESDPDFVLYMAPVKDKKPKGASSKAGSFGRVINSSGLDNGI